MTGDDEATAVGARPLRRFWRSAVGFWVGAGSWMPWALIGLLVVCVVSQLLVQYRLNLWNRDFFNALEQRDGVGIRQQTYLLPALAAAIIALAAIAVWGRMTFQLRWRDWLTSHLLGLWLDNDNYRRIEAQAREPQLAEYRIAEDARVATYAPIDLLVGLLASVLTAATFVAVLWTVGGSLELGGGVELPGYLVFASIVYAMITTAAMIVVGHNMANVIERKNQAQSELWTDPLRAQVHRRIHVARRGDAGGSGVCRRPRCLQLAGRQLSATGRMGVVGQPRRHSAVRP